MCLSGIRRSHPTQRVEQYLLSWCKILRPFTIPTNIPSLEVFEQFCTTVDVQLQKMISKRQLDQVTNWKERVRHDWRQSRQISQWFRNEPFCSMSVMPRPDGNLMGNLEEIDEIVQTAWKPMFRNNKSPS